MAKNFELPAAPKMLTSDSVSGSLFLKFIQAYKEYDDQQKRIIRNLQTDLDFLLFEEPERARLLAKERELNTLRRTVCRLRKDNEDLICRLALLQARHTNAKQL